MPRLLFCCLLTLGLVASSCAGRIETVPPAADPDGGEGVPGALAFADEPTFDLDVLRLALRRPEGGWLPADVSLADQPAVILADLFYDGLTEAPVSGEGLRPALAVAWTPSPDFREWRFDLDTDRISTEAVVDHFSALLALEARPAVTSLLADVEAVSAVDGDTVTFALARPNAALPWLLSGVGASVVGPDGEPTGRYVIEADDGEELHLEPVDGAPHGLPTVMVLWETSERRAYDLLTLGLVDGAVGPGSSLGDAAARFGHEPSWRSITWYVGVAIERAGPDDDRLRRAVRQAVDPSALVEPIEALHGRPVGGVAAPSLAGAGGLGCGRACAPEPSLAEANVDAVSRERGEPVALTVAYSAPEHRPVIEAIGRQLSAAGVDVEILELPPSELAAGIVERRYDLFVHGTVAPAASVDAVLPGLLRSDSAAGVLGLESAEVDELVDRAARTGDDQRRWALLAEAERLASSSGRVIPLHAAPSHLVLAPPAAGLVVRADGSIDVEASR